MFVLPPEGAPRSENPNRKLRLSSRAYLEVYVQPGSTAATAFTTAASAVYLSLF